MSNLQRTFSIIKPDAVAAGNAGRDNSANTQGSSSVTDNTVTSLDPNYNCIFVAGLSLAVGGSNQIIRQQSQ